jgi:hypothetical protein
MFVVDFWIDIPNYIDSLHCKWLWRCQLNRGARGIFILSLHTWHLWHFLTYSMQSLSMVIQKYPDLCICIAVIYPLHELHKSLHELPGLLFLLLSYPNISTMFYRTTFCITHLHWGNSPWLTFARFLYLYWMPLGDFLVLDKLFYIIIPWIPIHFSFNRVAVSQRISDFNTYGLHFIPIINFGHRS